MRKLFLLGITLFVSLKIFAQSEGSDDIDFYDQLLHTTVRIVVVKKDSTRLVQGTGTGFIFDFAESPLASRPYIITNRHVIQGAIFGGFEISKADSGGMLESKTHPLYLPDFAKQWTPHPDPKVDLCIMPLAPLVNEADSKGIRFYYKGFNSDNIPTEEEWNSLYALENILMLGYPIGLIDTTNNIPLIRTGTTSSPPYKDFNGKKEFVIDAGCFPGSSGSPILYVQPPLRMGSKKNLNKNFMLLGILYAGPEMKVNGEIVVREIDVEAKEISETRIPINLGYVIKSSRINDFRELIDK